MLHESRWRTELARLESALRPIATRPVNTSDPNWSTKLKQSNPLDEAGVRGDAEALLLDILLEYAGAADTDRQVIRGLVAEYPSFFWAAVPPAGETAAATLRLHLIHFAILDQSRDPRDAVLRLDKLCRTPGVSPDELVTVRREVAPMASDDDRYGFGSTRSMLLQGYGDYGRASAPERAR